ncbi:DeoR/GlpR family DNA-binding transcription regulator [Curtobacterium sp. MCBD17_003]|uniref:DeoR/GlpR family DNA-binding transcription regulator n=1 Tax=Curtobacterium sp. MCBD17_003 TaxID=2175667 RepID=UPI000DA945C8|nr:DeoR/GlpR family DNA-binding transcription regulator [Curtobacterium sp. MCBD17_003]WIE55702.1 DeoR/GlpR family DNA-binding transcription regulator [Curtobacterium sp. MCBD17_003]
MQRKQRLNQIVAAIVENTSMDVPELAERFAVSEATVRRDLELLEQQQLVSRTRGGATRHVAFNDLPLGYKTSQDAAEKHRIARAALAYLEGARVVGLTGGTTVWEFAQQIGNRTGLTVVTNALNIATGLVEHSGVRVFAAGGEVRSSSQETVGPSAEAFLSDYHIDVSFVGVDGVDATAGCTNYDPVGARVNAMMSRRSRATVVLADATKIGRMALASVCSMADVDVLVTDTRAPDSAVEAIERQGCRVVRA